MNLISQGRELSVPLLSKGSCTLICLFGVIQLELQILCWILLKAVTRFFSGRHLHSIRLRTDRPPLFHRGFVQEAVSELLTHGCTREVSVFPQFCNPLHGAVQSS